MDQLVEIIKVLGTPTKTQIRLMNPNYGYQKFPQIKSVPLSIVSSLLLLLPLNSLTSLSSYTDSPSRLTGSDLALVRFTLFRTSSEIERFRSVGPVIL